MDGFGGPLALLGLSSTGLACGPVASMLVEVSPRHTGVMATVIAPGGDVDVASVAALFADRTRARVLMALSDGRALPASVLATEAGVTAQAASAQLSRLQAAGLLAVEQSGRHRYYRLATGQVDRHPGGAGPARARAAGPVAAAVDSGGGAAFGPRLLRPPCRDGSAFELAQALIDHRALAPSDGIPDTRRRSGDRLSSQLAEHPWALGPSAGRGLRQPRRPPGAGSRPTAHPVGRCCGSAWTGASSATTWPASSAPRS